MDKQYFIDGKNIRLVVGNYTTMFNEDDVEGFYRDYLAWVAEGNEAQPWE